MSIDLLTPVPWLPLIGAILCGLCCAKAAWRKAAGPICVASITASLILVLLAYSAVPDGGATVGAFRWIHVGKLTVDFSYYIDSLTMLMLMVVTGIGALISLYSIGYMAEDPGAARFFAGVSLFIFAMTTLVMANNLALLYLGWEGVGLCSYLLIGHYYQRPEAVAAAKKAFVVNRVGDFGFLLGIFLTWYAFGTLNIPTILHEARALLAAGNVSQTSVAAAAAPFAAAGAAGGMHAAHLAIPFLLMLGALGKSAQLPLHVWLPDAMAGPTPISALIHAATMVTAGVYMIARLVALFMLSPYALPTVAAVGAITALFAATIALRQYDLKRIWAYSTISQLGYMFLGVGALSTFSGVFHLFTHAFFKALLFLTAGSVMHALAGQLDLRKISGLRKKMPVTCWLMFAGCLALAGFPFISAGFYSKDAILGEAMRRGLDGQPLYAVLSSIGLITAFLTAMYTFRLWFRVFMGPESYEMGDEPHGLRPGEGASRAAALAHQAGDAEALAAARSDQAPAADAHAQPHEMPWWPMNAPLVVLAAGAILAGFLGVGGGEGWIGGMIHHSTADVTPMIRATAAGQMGGGQPGAAGQAASAAAPLATTGGVDLHWIMVIVSSVLVLAGIGAAAYYHWLRREAADRAAQRFAAIAQTLYRKYYVDELYDRVIVTPLRLIGSVCSVFDVALGGAAYAVAFVPRLLAYGARPGQNGRLQSYGLGMIAGLGVLIAVVLFTTW